jgi:hypothetical protein
MSDPYITDEAVEAAERAYMERWRDRVPAPGAGMRAALEAALPHLRVQETPVCRGCSIDPSSDPGIPDQFIPDGDCPVHGEAARLNAHQQWHLHLTPETRPVVDREALLQVVAEYIDDLDGVPPMGTPADHLERRAAHVTDAVLALINGGAQ